MGARGPGFAQQDRHYKPHDLAMDVEQWMTPNTPNGGRKTSRETVLAKGATLKGKRQVPLEAQAEFWPTLAARDYRDVNLMSYQERHGKEKGEQLNNFVAHYWITPQTSDVNGERTGRSTPHPGFDGLNTQAEKFFSPPVLPTPDGLPFWVRVRCLLRLCRLLKSSLRSPYNRARSMFRRKLNPNFVDWLQGLPPGFTSVEFDSRRMETWLSLCRRRLASLN